MNRYATLAPLVALALACSSPDDAPRVDLAIEDVAIVDVRTGVVTPGRTILIDGDSIVGIVGSSDGVRAERSIDGAGLYAIPGLRDMHVHVLWADSIPEQLLPRFVAWGVTTVRDMGGTAEGLVAAHRAASEPAWPRVVAAGPVLDGPEPVDPSISFAVATPADAVAAVDSLHALGADFVKVYTLLPGDAFFAAARRAAELGLRVAGHVPGDVTVAEAARAGMRSIEHLREEIEPFCTRADSIACDALLVVLDSAHVWQTPTLVVLDAKTRLADTTFAAPPAAGAMPAAVREMWQSMREGKLDRDAAYWQMRRDRWADVLWLTARLERAGVAVLAGTDTPVLFTYPGESLHDELELLVSAGLSPLDALRTATLEPARYLEETDRYGAIDARFAADLVLLGANPLDDIRATRDIRAVVHRGRWLDRAALDSLLAR